MTVFQLGGKEHSNNSASESLSSLSLGLDEGCALQGLIDDLKKEIESKDLVLRDRHAEMERLQQELSQRDRQLSRCRERQELFDGEKTSFLQKIVELEENVDDHSRTIAMLNMEKVKLSRQVEDLKETLQQYRDNLQKTSEEKVAIEDECKNLLVTISNLRIALEETKRNGSSSVSFFSGLRYSQPPPPPQSYRVSYLHANGKDDTQRVTTPSPTLTNTADQRAVTGNNILKDNELDQYRDSNLQLRCQLAELSRELGNLKDFSDAVDIRQEELELLSNALLSKYYGTMAGASKQASKQVVNEL
uniref:Uncharacterized protein n=1 Tax=Anopheles maculatus TaxID=74869 RepID=A0A182SCR7_9DIPT